jgi:hypothetical protein
MNTSVSRVAVPTADDGNDRRSRHRPHEAIRQWRPDTFYEQGVRVVRLHFAGQHCAGALPPGPPTLQVIQRRPRPREEAVLKVDYMCLPALGAREATDPPLRPGPAEQGGEGAVAANYCT